MEEQFKIGDIVRLKSGGPNMTVSSDPSSGGIIECKWFQSFNNQLASGSFNAATLIKVEPAENAAPSGGA